MAGADAIAAAAAEAPATTTTYVWLLDTVAFECKRKQERCRCGGDYYREAWEPEAAAGTNSRRPRHHHSRVEVEYLDHCRCSF